MCDKSEVLLTGCTGFLGEAVLQVLLDHGHPVTAIVRKASKSKGLLLSYGVNVIESDVFRDEIEIENLSQMTLLHLAWEGLPNYNSLHHIEVNLRGSYDFIKRMVVRGLSRVVVTGTCFEYGLSNGPQYPGLDVNPVTSYALAKHHLHKQLIELSKNFEFDLLWLRLFYLFGDNQNKNSLLPKLWSSVNSGLKEFDMSQGEQLRDYIEVEAAATKIIGLIADGKNGIANICSGVPISVRRFIENYVQQHKLDVRLNFGRLPYNDYEPMAYWGHNPDI